ncbi:MAG: hypothetical protein EA391_02910, partial [Balneolaceae bacterium]
LTVRPLRGWVWMKICKLFSFAFLGGLGGSPIYSNLATISHSEIYPQPLETVLCLFNISRLGVFRLCPFYPRTARRHITALVRGY